MIRTFKYTMLLFLLPVWFAGAAAYAQVGLSIHDTSGVSGAKLTIPIYVDSTLTGKGVTSYQLQLSYNTYAMAWDSVITAGSMSSTGSISYHESAAGTLNIASAGSLQLTGTGVLVFVRFRLLNTGDYSISFSGEAANNFFNEGSPSILFRNGTISIQPPLSISIYPSDGMLTVGDKEQFTASNGKMPYHWSLTNPSAASIDSNGLLTATHSGFTKVAARDSAGTIDTIGGVIEVRAFRLSIHDTSYIQGQTFNLPVYTSAVTGLNITAGSFQILFNQDMLTPVGIVQTGTLTASYPAAAYSNNVSGVFNLSFAGSASLNGSGILVYVRFKVSKTNSGGSTIYPANILFNETVQGDSAAANFQTVNLASLTVNPSTVNMIDGDTLRFTVSGGTPPYAWSTSDSTVASINSAGLLQALKGGSVVVNAVDVYGGTGASGTIQVYDVRISIPDTAAAANDSIDVPVSLSSLAPGMHIQSIQAILAYDTSVLKAEGIINSGTLTSGWSYSSSVTGTQLTFAGAGSTNLSGAGILCKIRFLSSATAGRYSALYMQQCMFNEGSPRPLITGGSVTVPNLFPPVLSSPVNGAASVGPNSTLIWNSSAGAASYRLQISTDAAFGTIFYDTSGITTTYKSIGGLAGETNYFWRVSAAYSEITSAWSAVWSFTTGPAVSAGVLHFSRRCSIFFRTIPIRSTLRRRYGIRYPMRLA